MANRTKQSFSPREPVIKYLLWSGGKRRNEGGSGLDSRTKKASSVVCSPHSLDKYLCAINRNRSVGKEI